MKLAVVIPYYKIDFFRDTLVSLANQTNKDFTVYVGNDASPHNPVPMIDEFSKRIAIRYRAFEENLGNSSLTKQWLRCINEVQNAQWVMILGDDDVLEKKCIANFYDHLEAIEQKNIDVVRYASLVIDENSNPISEVHKHPLIENSVRFLFKKMNGNARSSMSEHIFKLSVLQEIQFENFPLAWHSDDLALLEISRFGELYTINSSVVLVRSSNVNISGRKGFFRIKNEASSRFYQYLIKRHHQHFSEREKEILLKKYEKTILNDKRNFLLFLRLSRTYLTNLNFNNYFRFIRIFFFSFLNGKNFNPR